MTAKPPFYFRLQGPPISAAPVHPDVQLVILGVWAGHEVHAETAPLFQQKIEIRVIESLDTRYGPHPSLLEYLRLFWPHLFRFLLFQKRYDYL